jgi:hypothetical protein
MSASRNINCSARRNINMGNSLRTEPGRDSIIAHATQDLRRTVIVEPDAVRVWVKLAMDRFEDCLMSCDAAGFATTMIDCHELRDGSQLMVYIFDLKSPEGPILLALLRSAMKGIRPPEPTQVLALVRKAAS